MRKITLGTSVQHVSSLDHLYSSITLGMDTELLPSVLGERVYPHQVSLSQTRPIGPGIADWHGDGFAFELCVEATTCLDTLMVYVMEGFMALRDGFGVNSVIAPALYTVPDVIYVDAPPGVKRLGCKPSQNVYGKAGDPEYLPENVRTTGCHLHMSIEDSMSPELRTSTVKWSDVLVGTVWTALSPNLCKDEKLRRRAYGRAGEYRATTYDMGQRGVEYRVLPGTVALNPVLLTLCFALYREALVCAVDHGDPPSSLSDSAVDIINNARRGMARSFVGSLNWNAKARNFMRFYLDQPPEVLSLYTLIGRYHNTLGYRKWYAKYAPR